MTGLSPRNLTDLAAFVAVCPNRQIVQHVVAQIAWCLNSVSRVF